jgi:RNA polymerase sigma-70 factor, ECF subfamily
MGCGVIGVLPEEVCKSSSGSRSRPSGIRSFKPASRKRRKSVPICRDEHVMHLVQSGDADAMGHLFERYSRPVLSLAMRILRNRADAQEVLQDVFLYIHRKSALFVPARGTVASWVLQVAYSKSLNRRRQVYAAPSSSPVGMSVLDHLTHPDMDPQRVVDKLSAGKLVRLALPDLPEHQRETLWLYFSDGYSLREISKRRKERLGNTRHHFYRGIETLRRTILANAQTAGNENGNQRLAEALFR